MPSRRELTDRRGFGVLGMGHYLPARVIDNAHIAQRANVTEEWILAKTGVQQRHRAAEGETTADLGAEAARHALKDAARRAMTPIATAPPEMVVFATSTPDRQLPAPVFDLHQRLGLPHIPALSIDGACAGFAQGMLTSYGYFHAGMAETSLVVGAHRSGILLDESNPKVAPLIGDGGGAFLMGEVPAGYGIIGYEMLTDSSYSEVVCTPARGSVPVDREFMEMDGGRLMEIFAREMPRMIDSALAQCDLTVADIDHLVLHQANVRMVEVFSAALELPPERVGTSGRSVGNTSAASLPIGLVVTDMERPIERDSIVVFATAGSGVCGAVVVMRWF